MSPVMYDLKGGSVPNRYGDGLVQEGRNSIANTLELCLSYTNPKMGS